MHGRRPQRYALGPLSAAAVLGVALQVVGDEAAAAPPPLPVPCVSGNCGNNSSQFVTSGTASAIQSGNSLSVQQTTNKATLNWASFNIAVGNSVSFQQPNSNSIALNRIFDANPSSIFGSLSANGQLYLINANGFLFGATSKVNVAGLIASSLNISDSTFSAGILAPLLQNAPALEPFTDASGNAINNTGNISIQAGAQLTAADGGRLLLAAPTVQNNGTLTANDGQVVLAAGQAVFLKASTADDLRGLVVEVDQGGTAWNQLQGSINAAHGNISLVGLMVNQEGRISATTSVASNGSVILEAADTHNYDVTSLTAKHGGQVQLGPDSTIEVLPDYSDPTTAVDAQAQLPSEVSIIGQQVLLDGPTINAPSGNLSVTAAASPAAGVTAGGNTGARIRIDNGTTINLAGSTAELPVSANLVSVQLRSNELADDPAQRNGALRGQTVIVDARADGGKGTPIADVSSAIAAVGRTIAQRTETGGNASFESEGDIVFAPGSSINVSGGQTNYQAGVVQTTQLIGANGRLYDIGSASPNLAYSGVLNPTFTQVYNQWGQQEIAATPGLSHYESGYVQGASAGSIDFAAPAMALAGSLTGNAVSGPYQRSAATAVLGGTLTIGVAGGVSNAANPSSIYPDFLAPAVLLQASAAAVTVGDAAALPAGPLQLPVTYLISDGFASTRIFSDFSVTLPTGLPLSLRPGSALQLEAPRIELDSSIASLAGKLSFDNVATIEDSDASLGRLGIGVADGVTFDVSGQWTNDTPAPGNNPTLQQGGSIQLQLTAPASQLILGNDVSLKANGGAWVAVNGQVTDGAAGAITIDASPSQAALQFGANLQLQGFGVGDAAGGSFALLAPRIAISQGSDTAWTAAQRVDDLISPGGVLNLYAPLFANEGFSAIGLTATGGVLPAENPDALTVAANTSITAASASWQLQPGYLTHASGGSVASFVQPVTLPQYARKPVNVSLNVLRENDSITPVSSDVGTLDVQAGVSIVGDPQALIDLTSEGSILMDGTLRAPGGQVTLQILSFSDFSGVIGNFDRGFQPDQRIDVGPHASIDVGGTALLTPNNQGLDLGSVLPGGSVNLLAERGTVQTDAGSSIDISGGSATLDVLDAAVPGGYAHRTVASAAGSLKVSAVESISLGGDLRARAGVGDSGNAAAGSLEVDLTAPVVFVQGLPAFPSTPYEIELIESTAGLGPSGPNNNEAMLGLAQLTQSGIDSLTLSSLGSVMLATSVPLSLARQLAVSAPTIAVAPGVEANLQAPFVQIGNGTVALPTQSPVAGSGTLAVGAQQLNLLGDFTLDGVKDTVLTSAGDVQLQGVVPQGGSAAVGAVTTGGNLTVAAERVYPDTATSFVITSLAPAGTVTLNQVGSSPGSPLSAGGSVTIDADNIAVAGTLLAPFGSISLTAGNDLGLAAGSLVSVSGAGLQVPYGQTQQGATQWLYQAGPSTQVITGVPSKQLTLSAPNIATQSGSTIDVQGGGDLYAYEWVPGTGGSTDALALGSVPGLYAIVPSMKGQAAPYDLEESGSTSHSLAAYLSGLPGLPAGYYALLPPRYALLPGADLVQIEPSYTSAQAGQIGTLQNGAPVVAGYLTSGTSGLYSGATLYQGFAVYPGSYGQQLAAYTISTASSYFSAAAAQAGISSVALPADAGTLTVNVVKAGIDSLTLQGEVLTAAANGGRGAQINLSAPDLEVTAGTAGPAAAASGVAVSASILQGWNASELTLGGIAGVDSAGNATVAAVADSVTVDAGAQLTADQILLVAQNAITVHDGASLFSTSGKNQTALATLPVDLPVTLTDSTGAAAPEAALLALSDLNLPVVDRSGASGSGGAAITLQSGATLASRGALALDAPGGVAVLGSLVAPGASLSLASNSIAFGAGVAATDTLQIDSALLASLQAASAVRLASASSIDLNTAVTLGGGSSLTLMAASLNNQSGGDSQFGGKIVTLEGSAAGVAAPVAGSGTLNFAANQLNIGPGILSINGFASTQAQVDGAVVGAGSGGITVGGNLGINAAELTADETSQTQISAPGGTLRIGAPVVPSGPTSMPSLIGGNLTLSGQAIDDAGTINVPAGLISLVSNSTLHMASTASISAAGATVQQLGQVATAPGGAISLSAAAALTLDSGATLNVAGSAAAPAGSVSIASGAAADVSATLAGGSAGSTGGRFSLDAGQLGSSLTALAANLTAGGFTDQLSVRTRQGDLDLASGASLTSNQISLTADSGAIDIAGALFAPSGNQRGNIGLYAGTGITLAATGELHADATGSGGRAGTIELDSSCATCAVTLTAGSRITAMGASQMGQLVIRAPVLGAADVAVNVGSRGLGADVSQVGQVVIIPESTFAETAATINADLPGDVAAVAAYVAGAAPGVATRLATGSVTPISVQGGVNIIDATAADTLMIPGIDLSPYSTQGQVINLSVRAAGAIGISGAISDGIVTDPATGAPTLTATPSASMRFVAGADLSSADPLLTAAGVDADLSLTAGTGLVRTGTGQIDLVAAHDVIFGNGASAYSAGEAAAPAASYRVAGTARLMNFATNGGNVDVVAGHDVQGAPVSGDNGNFTVTAWQVHAGNQSVDAQYGVDFAAFDWNLMALGGGDLSVTAGHDAANVSAAVSDSLASAAQTASGKATLYGAGGGLVLQAGNDIGSAQVYVADGVGTLTAGGGLTPIRTGNSNGDAVGSVFALGNSQISVWARNSVQVETAYNPQVLNEGQGVLSGRYFTYGDHSGLNLESTDGSVTLEPGVGDTLSTMLGKAGTTSGGPNLQDLPANLSLQSLQNDIDLGGGAIMYPSSTGQLVVFAGRDIVGNSSLLAMSDGDPSTVPTTAAPGLALALGAESQFGLKEFQAGIHAGDTAPALITAARDISGVNFSLPKAAQIIAGRDILNMGYNGQNANDSDTTLVSAGRDISYTGSAGGIAVGGTGALDVLAGRNINLGLANGITTTGDLLNPNLPSANGADINVWAGIGSQGPDYAQFIRDVVAPSSQYQSELISYVDCCDSSPLSFDAAVTLFDALSQAQKLPLIEAIFFHELLLSGREANAGTGAGFGRGYAAIDALFPNSRTAVAKAPDPYAGNLNMTNSQVYTLSGGSISILTPGGAIDVGLANPPPSVLQKPASSLGIVAQGLGDVDIYSKGDVDVNKSRIFTLGGGNILIWSDEGSIDAGNGSKSSLSVPPPVVLINADGTITLDFGASLAAGSGIRTIQTSSSVAAGSVDLDAPEGTVNAGDAGIGAAGNINIAAAHVIGLDNIQFGGTATGVPAQISSVGASLSGASAVASSSTTSATDAAQESANGTREAAATLAQSALSWLEVFVTGLGEENCKPDDIPCLQRQKHE